MIIAMWAFKNRRMEPDATLQPGADILVSVIPFDKADEKVQTTQRSDEIGEYDLGLYWALNVTPVTLDDALRKPLKNDASLASKVDLLTSPGIQVNSKATAHAREKVARKLSIEKDLRSIESALMAHGGNWKAWDDSLAPLREDIERKGFKNGGFLEEGNYYYYTSLNEMKWGTEKSLETRWKQVFRALVRLNTELRERGIDLILVPFPYREEINAGVFSDLAPQDMITMPYKLMFFHALLKADVEVINLGPLFREKGRSFPFLYYNCRDAHPADGAIQLAAEATARRLDRYQFTSDAHARREKYTSKIVHFSVTPPRTSFPKDAVFPATVVLDENGAPLQTSDPQSLLLVMGDSFIGVPEYFGVPSANFVAHLAKETGVISARLVVQSATPQIMQHLARKGHAFLNERRVCVFAFNINYLFHIYRFDETPDIEWTIIDLP